MNKVITRLNKMGARDPETGCLRWTGAKTTTGYGRQWDGNRVQQVHRLAYEFWVGPIPDGLEIDHVYERGCRHRDCYEPTHLEVVSHIENLRRRRWSDESNPGRPAGVLPPKCRKGHDFTPENTSYYTIKKTGGTGRTCKTCKAEQNRKRYQ
jgi:hypothetical protein